MKLVVFDIDGTLINSVAVDDACFIQTFGDLFQIEVLETDWSKYNHVTDAGLTQEIFQHHFGRQPEANELISIKTHFLDLLKNRQEEMKPIIGAISLIDRLSASEDTAIAFATGGWSHTAHFKLDLIGCTHYTDKISTSDDHHARTEILKLAVKKAKRHCSISDFDRIVSIGDGLWDLKAADELGFEFIGVDHLKKGKLQAAGAKQVVENLSVIKSV